MIDCRPAGGVLPFALACIASSCSSTTPDNGAEPTGIARLLADGRAVFGIFSGPKTEEQGALMARNSETDFVFYSLERGPFDIDTMTAFARAMAKASGDGDSHPLLLRIPPIRDGEQQAHERAARALEAGVDGIVFPHVESARQAEIAVDSMAGNELVVLIIEDRAGVENAGAIARTPGVDVVFAGPGDLRRAYARDMEAVENAIQTVLAACQEAGMPAGITAGTRDIAARVEQGFRVIIVTQPEALATGRRAAGR